MIDASAYLLYIRHLLNGRLVYMAASIVIVDWMFPECLRIFPECLRMFPECLRMSPAASGRLWGDVRACDWMLCECDWMFPECDWMRRNVPWMFPETAWKFPKYVPWMFPECSLLNVPYWIFPAECSLNVPWMFTECSLNVPRMFFECSLSGDYAYTVAWGVWGLAMKNDTILADIINRNRNR